MDQPYKPIDLDFTDMTVLREGLAHYKAYLREKKGRGLSEFAGEFNRIRLEQVEKVEEKLK